MRQQLPETGPNISIAALAEQTVRPGELTVTGETRRGWGGIHNLLRHIESSASVDTEGEPQSAYDLAVSYLPILWHDYPSSTIDGKPLARDRRDLFVAVRAHFDRGKFGMPEREEFANALANWLLATDQTKQATSLNEYVQACQAQGWIEGQLLALAVPPAARAANWGNFAERIGRLGAIGKLVEGSLGFASDHDKASALPRPTRIAKTGAAMVAINQLFRSPRLAPPLMEGAIALAASRLKHLKNTKLQRTQG